jgi:hypothetical protein
MKVYIKVDSNNNIYSISSEYEATSIEVESNNIEFIPGYNKIYNGIDIVDVIDENYNNIKNSITAKNNKINNVATILVTTISGKVFDGDEKSQDRMVRAIQVAAITGLTETQWKLADNSRVMVTLDELKEALALAGQEMSRIWLV